MKNLYIVRKFITANSLKQAQKLEPKTPPSEIYLEEQSIKNLYPMEIKDVAGFKKEPTCKPQKKMSS